jgi:diguanylate cyclase (GGDEF)-like protein/PAS domain S-box-containing protein
VQGEIGQVHIENRYIDSQGRAFWGEINVSPTLNDKGQVESTIGFIIDITKRKQAEMALRETERRFREILENIQLLAIMLDAAGNITFCNNHILEVTGWEREEVIGRNWLTYFLGADESARLDFSRALQRGAIVLRHENSLQTRRGKELIISWTNIALKDENDSMIGMAGLGQDITERRRAHDAEREQRILAESLTSTAEILTSSLKFSETMRLILENVGRVVPHDAANISLIKGRTVRFVGSRGYEEKGISQQALESTQFNYKSVYNLRQMYETKQPVVISDTTIEPNWKVFPVSAWIKSYIGAPILVQGKVVGFLSLDSDKPGFFKQAHAQRLAAFSVQAAIAIENARLFEKSQKLLEDRRKAQARLSRANKRLETKFAEIEQLQARLREQAIRDPLTGLFNRRYLDETMGREIARAEREHLPISILMFDIDHFKIINDTYGHEAGDMVLKALGGILLRESRRSDIACRFGGEEFCIIMIGAPLRIGQQRAEAWREAFSRFSLRHKQQTLSVTTSIGVAVYPEHGTTVNDVLRVADEALYAAKQAGRNRVEVAPFPVV